MLEELKKIGLSENETRVYLALLELGGSTAQEISKKAGVKRATTYVQLEALMKFGLVTSFEKAPERKNGAQKTFFRAEDPEHLADHGEARAPVRLEGDAGHVGRHDDARQVEQGTVERAWLLLEHVQAGGADLPGDQGLEYARRGSRESRPPCACLQRPRPPCIILWTFS